MKVLLLVIALLLIGGCSTIGTLPWSEEEVSSLQDHEVKGVPVVVWEF